MTEFTEEQRKRLEEYLATHHLPKGMGTKEEACSLAAINLAISGRLEDKTPECMSPVVARWIIYIQDALPDDMRNSSEWKSLLPLAAGTGRSREQERREIIKLWLWESVMPEIQPFADRIEMGDEWRELTVKRDYSTAVAIREKAWVKRKAFWDAADAAVAAVAAADAAVADAAVAAAVAAAAVADAAVAAAVAAAAAAVANAADAADAAVADAADAAVAAADAAVADAAVAAAVAAAAAAVADAADAAARRKFFLSVDIYGVLRKLIEASVKPGDKAKLWKP